MKYLKIYLVVLIAFFGCRLNAQSQDLCKTLSDLYEKDQLYRGQKSMQDPFFKVFDSVRKSEGITRKVYMSYPKEKQLEYGRKIRAIVDKMNVANQSVQDSLMDKQVLLDIENTKKMIEITKKYGFPDIKKLKCTEYSAPFLIFVHSPENFWKEIKDLIEVERKKKRISEGDYNYISWHLNGRKGAPIKINN